MSVRRIIGLSALIALTVLVGLLALREAALGWWMTRPPEEIPQLLSGEPTLKLQSQLAALARNPQLLASDAPRLAGQAKVLLRDDALSGLALYQWGIATWEESQQDAIRAFNLAERISRRNLANEMQLINLAAASGDVTKALRHHDRVLRVFAKEATPVSYPVLARALADAEIRRQLARQASAPWFANFVGSALAQGAQGWQVVDLMALAGRHMSDKKAQELRASLVGQLAQRGLVADLRKLIAAMPEEVRKILADPGFGQATSRTDLAPLTWALRNDSEVQALVRPDGALAVNVAAERNVAIAERLTLLDAGPYELRLHLAYPGAGPRPILTWEVDCRDDGGPQRSWRFVMSPTGGTREYRIGFVVPRDCAAQVWRLSGTAEVSQFPSSAELRGPSLTSLAGANPDISDTR